VGEERWGEGGEGEEKSRIRGGWRGDEREWGGVERGNGQMG